MQVSDNHLQARKYLEDIDSLGYDDLADAMAYKWFRLNTLYHIKNKSGKKILFQPNQEQESFYCGQHNRDIILKARQLGFTTFKMISDLDDCLFIENFSAGCICHNVDSAKDIFRNKIKFAYNNITEDQRILISEIGYSLPTPVSDKGNAYVFSNGSSIKVGTSYRGDTLQSLHVSEFGKICKKYPDKATEIVTGAFESVPTDSGIITLESTAEGKEGYFFKYCNDAKRLDDLKKDLSVLDFKFHFFSWWLRPEYSIDGDVSPALIKYFEELEHKHGIKLNNRQRAWYSAKWKVLGDDMRREYPSTPKEAFEQSIEGAYYAKQFLDIYKDGRILDISGYDNHGNVHVQSDIGVGDSTALWFYRLVGKEIHLLHYYSNSGEGLGHYLKYIEDKMIKMKWKIGKVYGPHDMNNREFGSNGKTRKQLAMEGVEYMGETYRLQFHIVPKLGIDDGIQLVRSILQRCVFDESCEQGILALESYKKQWNDKLGCWRDTPLHDWASDGADSFRYLAVTENQTSRATTAARLIV
tara:strand:+ start:446 stop:2023 length:1578 start_codon:yes stop_codon:yes gene_type:complete